MSLVSMQTNRWVAKVVTITQAFGERARVSEACNDWQTSRPWNLFSRRIDEIAPPLVKSDSCLCPEQFSRTDSPSIGVDRDANLRTRRRHQASSSRLRESHPLAGCGGIYKSSLTARCADRILSKLNNSRKLARFCQSIDRRSHDRAKTVISTVDYGNKLNIT